MTFSKANPKPCPKCGSLILEEYPPIHYSYISRILDRAYYNKDIDNLIWLYNTNIKLIRDRLHENKEFGACQTLSSYFSYPVNWWIRSGYIKEGLIFPKK